MYSNSRARHFSLFHAKCLLPRLDTLLSACKKLTKIFLSVYNLISNLILVFTVQQFSSKIMFFMDLIFFSYPSNCHGALSIEIV